MKTNQTHGELFDVCRQCESDFLSPEDLAAAQIPDVAKRFLVEVGLPTFVADFSFEFGGYDSDLKEGVIGVDGEDGIVIDDFGRLPPHFGEQFRKLK